MDDYKQIKCDKCGKTLLFMTYGHVLIKCPRCGHKIEIKISNNKE